jgi:transposase-like protein
MNQTNGDWEAMISTAESLFKKKNYKKALKAFMSICEVGDAKRVDQVWKLVMKCCKGFALDQK